MFCPLCGKEIADESRFCSYCGGRTGPEQPDVQPNGQPNEQPAQQQAYQSYSPPGGQPNGRQYYQYQYNNPPPNWIMPVSKETRVRVEDFSKIIPSTLFFNGS